MKIHNEFDIFVSESLSEPEGSISFSMCDSHLCAQIGEIKKRFEDKMIFAVTFLAFPATSSVICLSEYPHAA